jgi:hypothetical protein
MCYVLGLYRMIVFVTGVSCLIVGIVVGIQNVNCLFYILCLYFVGKVPCMSSIWVYSSVCCSKGSKAKKKKLWQM